MMPIYARCFLSVNTGKGRYKAFCLHGVNLCELFYYRTIFQLNRRGIVLLRICNKYAISVIKRSSVRPSLRPSVPSINSSRGCCSAAVRYAGRVNFVKRSYVLVCSTRDLVLFANPSQINSINNE